MKTVYTLQPYEEGIRSDGFYEVETAKEAYEIISNFVKMANHPVTIVLRKHEVEQDWDVCGSDSIKETIRLKFEK